MIDSLNAEKIKDFLPDKYNSLDILSFGEVDSTNNIIRKMAEDGANEGCTAIASCQTAGKGRLGKSFFSPEDTGIYMSILLRPTFKAENSGLITTAAAVAVCKALEALGTENPKIKWVNDIFVRSKKVCGILTESSLKHNGSFDYAVLGIGINVYSPNNGFSEDLRNIAGFIFPEKQENLRNRLSALIIEEFFALYERLTDKSFFGFYKQHCFVLGKEITVIKSGEKEKKATALDLDDRFRLLVDYGDKTEYLSSGEISIKI